MENIKTPEDVLEFMKNNINMSGGYARPVTEFNVVPYNLSFKEFNNYINSLDKVKKIKK